MLRNRLLERRNEILGRMRRLEAGLHELGERETEIEEEARKSSIPGLYERLDEAGKNGIRNIDRALAGISSGDCGICESCGDDNPFKRPEAIPWALLCVDCARERENAAGSISGKGEPFSEDRTPGCSPAGTERAGSRCGLRIPAHRRARGCRGPHSR